MRFYWTCSYIPAVMIGLNAFRRRSWQGGQNSASIGFRSAFEVCKKWCHGVVLPYVPSGLEAMETETLVSVLLYMLTAWWSRLCNKYSKYYSCPEDKFSRDKQLGLFMAFKEMECPGLLHVLYNDAHWNYLLYAAFGWVQDENTNFSGNKTGLY